MNISVVIPALDEAGQIEAAIQSALESASLRSESNPETASLEVIVVDGGSQDGTPVRAAAAGARVLTSPPGRARQLGEGARASRGDIILFLHADTRLPRGWVAGVRDALRDLACVGGAFGFRFEPGARDVPALRFVEWLARQRVRFLGLPYGDQALFVRREILEDMGGVPQAPIMEDLDLVWEMAQRGDVAAVPLDVETSSRRHRADGAWRTSWRHAAVAVAWGMGVDRRKLAVWARR